MLGEIKLARSLVAKTYRTLGITRGIAGNDLPVLAFRIGLQIIGGRHSLNHILSCRTLGNLGR